MERANSPNAAPAPTGWWTREHALVVVLVVSTAIAVFLCYLLAVPFLPAMAWALALAVLAHPLHQRIERFIRWPGLAAGVTVVLVALTLVAPTVLVGQVLVREARGILEAVSNAVTSGELEKTLEDNPPVARVLDWAGRRFDLETNLTAASSTFTDWASRVVTGSIWWVMQLLITFFILFYLFRDHRRSLRAMHRLVPLTKLEADRMFTRVADTIYATIYGTLVVSIVQGALGGLMFWILGLPAPVFWGVVMTFLAVVPILGPFVVWIPGAIYLAAQGEWVKALVLTAWGGVIVALIDNLLYPILVGSRMRLHTVPVFIAIIGGLFVFGVSGVILGPVILAVTWGLLDVWRERTEAGQPAENGVR